MAERQYIRIDTSEIEQWVRNFDDIGQTFNRVLAEEMRTYSLLVESGARALAHRYGGELEESIIAASVAVKNGMVIGEVGSNLAYAWIRHEAPYKPGKRPLYDRGIKIRDYYINGRGRRTRTKAKWRGQMPGRKFLERAVIATEKDFEEMANRALERALGELY